MIITTNNLDYLDKAFLRRFNLKIKFLPIKESNISKIINKYKKEFQLKGKLPKNYKEQLRGLRLGDIGNVNKNRKLFDIKTLPEYIEALRNEINARVSGDSVVGFFNK